jgi:hypothetical protein
MFHGIIGLEILQSEPRITLEILGRLPTVEHLIITYQNYQLPYFEFPDHEASRSLGSHLSSEIPPPSPLSLPTFRLKTLTMDLTGIRHYHRASFYYTIGQGFLRFPVQLFPQFQRVVLIYSSKAKDTDSKPPSDSNFDETTLGANVKYPEFQAVLKDLPVEMEIEVEVGPVSRS